MVLNIKVCQTNGSTEEPQLYMMLILDPSVLSYLKELNKDTWKKEYMSD